MVVEKLFDSRLSRDIFVRIFVGLLVDYFRVHEVFIDLSIHWLHAHPQPHYDAFLWNYWLLLHLLV